MVTESNFKDISLFCDDFDALDENGQLQAQIRKWKHEAGYWQSNFNRAKEREEELKAENAQLRAKLKLREKQLFAVKSEKKKGRNTQQKSSHGSNGNGNEQKGGTINDQSQRPRGQQPGSSRTNSSRRDYSHLPVMEHEHDLDESEKKCSICGQSHTLLNSTEDAEIIEIEVKAHRRKIIKNKYRKCCSCDNGQAAIITAKSPGRVLPRSPYGVSIWVELLLNKYRYALPINRSISRLEDIGLNMPAGTLTDGFKRMLALFEGIYDKLKEHNLSSELWGGDETGYKVFVPVEGKAGNRWQLWVFHTAEAVVYLLNPSRSAQVPLDYFNKSIEGILVVDRYSAYKKLARLYPGLTLAFCWAHLRRDFLECATKWPALQDWALDWVQRINDLFHLNNQRRQAYLLGQDYSHHQQELCTQIEVFKQCIDEERSHSSLPTGKREVLESAYNHWEGLTVFVEHPQVPMDNNGSERALRVAKLIAKNSYGAMSNWSAQLTQILLSVFATLQLWKINPRMWLTNYLQACADNYGKAPENTDEFIPWKMQPEQLKQLQQPNQQSFDSS